MPLRKPKRIEPAPGQESVWDYPRPPRLEPVRERVLIAFAGVELAESTGACRVLETSHPPTIYIPREDVRMEFLHGSPRRSFCEWKGQADHFTVRINGRDAANAAWTYSHPSKAFAAIAGYISFYPSRMDACFLGDERVAAQEGDFYGGWITSRIVGPFKGGLDSSGW